jgi:hypothetical protein
VSFGLVTLAVSYCTIQKQPANQNICVSTKSVYDKIINVMNSGLEENENLHTILPTYS